MFENEELSVRKPAWLSNFTACPSVDTPIVGKSAFIQTINAIYDRAKVTNVSQNNIIVSFVKKSSGNKLEVETKTEVIKKSEVLILRMYVD